MASDSGKLIHIAKELRLKKKLSQSFLIDVDILKQIANAIDEPDKTIPIVEIGAGAGFLTQYLLETGHPLIAIEIDPKMAAILEEKYGKMAQQGLGEKNFRIICNNVLDVELNSLIAPKGIIAGNIPYHLTGPILFKIAGELSDTNYPLRRSLLKAVLMVQKEVAERLTASAGDSAYSRLTIQLQFWFEISSLISVPRKAFYPAPAVDSRVIKLVPREKPVIEVSNPDFFSLLVKNSFMHRRKTLFNNLKSREYISEEMLKSTFNDLGISLKSRPQELTIEQFGALANALTPYS